MNERTGRYLRIRYTATGALAALAAVGVIAGPAVLAATPHTKACSPAVVARASASKTPAPPAPGTSKGHAPQPGSSRPFLAAVQQLVGEGTISASQGQAVDREIQSGELDAQSLASSGFTQTQLQAVQQALGNTKRALAPNVP